MARAPDATEERAPSWASTLVNYVGLDAGIVELSNNVTCFEIKDYSMGKRP
jgi:hypothetical protein